MFFACYDKKEAAPILTQPLKIFLAAARFALFL